MPEAEYTSRSCQWHIYYSAISCGLFNAWSRVYFKIMPGTHISFRLKLWIIECLKQSKLQDHVIGKQIIQQCIECLKQSILQDHVNGHILLSHKLWIILCLKQSILTRSCQGFTYYSALSSGLLTVSSRVYIKISLMYEIRLEAHIFFSLKLWIIECLKQSISQDHVISTLITQP